MPSETRPPAAILSLGKQQQQWRLGCAMGDAPNRGKKARPHKYNNKEKSWLYERDAEDFARGRFPHQLCSDGFSGLPGYVYTPLSILVIRSITC